MVCCVFYMCPIQLRRYILSLFLYRSRLPLWLAFPHSRYLETNLTSVPWTLLSICGTFWDADNTRACRTLASPAVLGFPSLLIPSSIMDAAIDTLAVPKTKQIMALAGVRVREGCGSSSKQEGGCREVMPGCAGQRGMKSRDAGVRAGCGNEGELYSSME